MAMRILATWMVLYFAYLWKDISCNVVRNLEQGVPAVNRWIDCELEQPQPWHHHSNSQPTFHNYGEEIAAIFYTTVAPPVIHTRVRQIQVPYVYSVHQMIEFNRRQELKNYFENYYNNNYHKPVYTTRHPELLTRPAEPLTASLYVTHKIEMPPQTSHATHNIGDLSNNGVTTENVIFEVTDPIPQTQKISTKKPSSIISLPTNMNTVSSLPSQLLELFHNISNYHKAQNSLANIEKEESTSIRTSQNENLFEVSETTERSSWDNVTISLDPRIINSSLPQFPDSSASIAFATTATYQSSYQSSATDHQLVNAEDEELNDRFGGSVSLKNDNMLSAYNKELPIIKFSNTNTSSEFVNNIDATRIDNTLAFNHNESFSEEEKEQIRKNIYLNKEMKISDHNDENDIKSANTSDIKYTAATNEDFSDNIVTTRTYKDISPTTEITRFTIVDTYITSETEFKITTLKSENRKIDISHPNDDMDNVKSSVDLQELDHNIDTFVNGSTTIINLEEREDTKFSAIESTTVMSLEVTTRMPINRNSSSSKNDDDFKMQTPNYNEILTTTKKSANFIENVNSYNINTIDNNITVMVVNEDAEQLDEKRSYNNVDEFEVFTESQNVSNTLEPLHIISTTMKSNNVFKTHYGAKEDETILVTEEHLPSVTYFDVEPVEELELEISTVFSSSTSTYADDDAENRDNPDDNLTDELVIPLAKVSQKILFNDIEERTLPTNRITDSVTEIGAVSVTASESQSTNTYIPNDDNHNTENDIGKGLNEIPKYIEVEAVTSKRKVNTAPEPADNFISIPSSGLELNEDNLEKNIIDINIEHRVTESLTPDENVTETSIKDVTPISNTYINGPGHRRTEKMLDNVIQMPQYNNNELVYENEKDASISQSLYFLPNAPAIANPETYYKKEKENQIVDLEKIDPEYIYVGEESLTQREYGTTFSDTKERHNISTSTLTNAIDYETETDSMPSDLSKFTESHRINIETQEDNGAFIDAISKKVTSGTYDEVNNDIYVNVDPNNLTESSIDHDMYEVFLRKNLTAGAKIMK